VRVALADIDNPNKAHFPNLALMKASTYYKKLGHSVELVHGSYKKGGWFDLVLKSKIFTWSKDKIVVFGDEVLTGGTGFDIASKLEPAIDRCAPDYDLYKGRYAAGSKLFETAGIGFTTRGCPRKCSFCFVPKKEGPIRAYMDVEEFINPNSNHLILLDNNILAHKHGISQIKKMEKMGLEVDFNQGLDPHIIAAREDIAELLSRLRYIENLRLACDEPKDKPALEKAVSLLRKHGAKARLFAYTIIMDDLEEAYDRIAFVDSLGVIPFAQAVRDDKNTEPSIYQKALQFWVASACKGLFYSLSFADYLRVALEYDYKRKTIKFRNRTRRVPSAKRNMTLDKPIKQIVDEVLSEDRRKNEEFLEKFLFGK
jgi:hypothetical protein